MYGELVPVGGGDPIPLLKTSLLLGRRESCDVVLRFSNVSSQHCQLTVNGGFWYVRDLNSRNGVKVNGQRVADTERRLSPGDVLWVAKHAYTIQYSPVDLGAVGPPPDDVNEASIFSKSLLERAGLQGRRSVKPVPAKKSRSGYDEQTRYDLNNDAPGQIKFGKVREDPI
ncbi:MAG: FHA domain-containing protein [Thermoguttaceae bacterium]|jgi:adenylate cyclase